jgi:uncharacterized protein involved in outer membrane biogenesis
MKKKVPIVIIVILAILGLGVLILSTVTISSPKIKNLVVKQADKALGRKVQIGGLRINLLRGIKVERIMIGNAQGFGKEPFLEGDSFVLKYHLWPLFKKQVVISKISFLKPRILIERNRKGIWNFADLIKPSEEPSEAKKKVPSKKGLALLLSEMSLRKGEITLRDRMFSSSNSETKVKDVNFNLSGLSPFSPTKVKASAGVEGGRLELSGQGNVFKKEGTFRLKLKDFDLTRISPAYKNLIPVEILSGELNLDLEGEIKEGKKLKSSGNISLKNLAFGISTLKVDKIEINDLKTDFLLAKRSLDFTAKVKIYEGELNSSGSLDLSAFTYKVKGTLQNFDLNKYVTATTPLKDMVYGTLESNFSFAGEKKKDIKGKIFVKMDEGKLSGLALQKQLAKFLKIPLVEDIKYKGMRGNFTVGEGIIKTDDFKIDGIDVDFLIKGTLSFEGDLNYTITAIFPGEYADRISEDERIASLFRNDEGKAVVPVRVRGTLKSPRFKLETAQIKKRVKEKLKEEFKKGIEEKIKDWLIAP